MAAGHVEHAYALTAHSLQGATVETACVVSRPDDHGARWSYTACSRARTTTDHIVINDEAGGRETTSRVDVLARLLDTMSRDDDDELAAEHLPGRRSPITDDRSQLDSPLWSTTSRAVRWSHRIDVSGVDLGR